MIVSKDPEWGHGMHVHHGHDSIEHDISVQAPLQSSHDFIALLSGTDLESHGLRTLGQSAALTLPTLNVMAMVVLSPGANSSHPSQVRKHGIAPADTRPMLLVCSSRVTYPGEAGKAPEQAATQPGGMLVHAVRPDAHLHAPCLPQPGVHQALDIPLQALCKAPEQRCTALHPAMPMKCSRPSEVCLLRCSTIHCRAAVHTLHASCSAYVSLPHVAQKLCLHLRSSSAARLAHKGIRSAWYAQQCLQL